MIIGDQPHESEMAKLAGAGLAGLPVLRIAASLSPGEAAFEVGSKLFQKLASKVTAGFQVAAHWHLYPGDAPPVEIVIDKLALLYHGDGNQYLAAVGRIVTAGNVRRIAHAQTEAYLAVPGPVVSGISETQLTRVPLDYETANLLFQRAREEVADEKWQADPASSDSSRSIQARNRIFLALSDHTTREFRAWRFAPGADPPLLLVEAVWIDESRNLPLFAVDAVVEGKTILSFNYQKAIWMRMGEFDGRDWRLKEAEPCFLNAWKIGPERFLLTRSGGLEGFSVALQLVEPAKGLAVVLGFDQ